MTNEIKPFNSSDLMDGVKSKIKETFVSLIPDEHWEKMVQSEIDKFMNDKKDRYDNKSPSEFSVLFKEVAGQFYREKIKEFLKCYESVNYNYKNNPKELSVGEWKASEMIEKMLIEKAPEIFAAVFKNMFQQAIYNMQNS